MSKKTYLTHKEQWTRTVTAWIKFMKQTGQVPTPICEDVSLGQVIGPHALFCPGDFVLGSVVYGGTRVATHGVSSKGYLIDYFVTSWTGVIKGRTWPEDIIKAPLKSAEVDAAMVKLRHR